MKFINQFKFSCQWAKNSISIFKSPYSWIGSSLNPLLHPFLDKNLLDMQSCWREHTYMWQYAMYGVVYQQKPSYQVNNQKTKSFRSVTFSWKVAILKWGLLLTLTILLLHPNLQHKWWNSVPDTHFICPYTKSGDSRRTMLAGATTKRFLIKILSFLSIVLYIRWRHRDLSARPLYSHPWKQSEKVSFENMCILRLYIEDYWHHTHRPKLW